MSRGRTEQLVGQPLVAAPPVPARLHGRATGSRDERLTIAVHRDVGLRTAADRIHDCWYADAPVAGRALRLQRRYGDGRDTGECRRTYRDESASTDDVSPLGLLMR